MGNHISNFSLVFFFLIPDIFPTPDSRLPTPDFYCKSLRPIGFGLAKVTLKRDNNLISLPAMFNCE
ncbi:hypothetical protein B7486_31575 [cyanobacterium TDX16]|nr:hypothetical protein B7486_31575 [cyanobacterium TDX16]